VATTAKLVALARNAPCLAHHKKSGILIEFRIFQLIKD
jgi:hypothetical protein